MELEKAKEEWRSRLDFLGDEEFEEFWKAVWRAFYGAQKVIKVTLHDLAEEAMRSWDYMAVEFGVSLPEYIADLAEDALGRLKRALEGYLGKYGSVYWLDEDLETWGEDNKSGYTVYLVAEVVFPLKEREVPVQYAWEIHDAYMLDVAGNIYPLPVRIESVYPELAI